MARVCEGAEFANGRLSAAVLGRATQRDMPFVATRVLNDRLKATGNRHIESFEDLTEARIKSASRGAGGEPLPFPVQVDGDYIGEFTEAEIGIEPRALSFVA